MLWLSSLAEFSIGFRHKPIPLSWAKCIAAGVKRRLSEQRKQIYLNSAKPLRRKPRILICVSCFARGHVKDLFNLLGKNFFAAHAFAEFAVVKFSAAKGADAVEHFVFAVGKMAREPVLEHRRDGV